MLKRPPLFKQQIMPPRCPERSESWQEQINEAIAQLGKLGLLNPCSGGARVQNIMGTMRRLIPGITNDDVKSRLSNMRAIPGGQIQAENFKKINTFANSLAGISSEDSEVRRKLDDVLVVLARLAAGIGNGQKIGHQSYMENMYIKRSRVSGGIASVTSSPTTHTSEEEEYDTSAQFGEPLTDIQSTLSRVEDMLKSILVDMKQADL